MTTAQHRTIARVTAWAAFALNVGVCVGYLVGRYYFAAAWSSVLAMLMAAWLSLLPKVEAWLDANVASARIHRDLQQTALEVMREQRRAGNARVTVSGVSVN